MCLFLSHLCKLVMPTLNSTLPPHCRTNPMSNGLPNPAKFETDNPAGPYVPAIHSRRVGRLTEVASQSSCTIARHIRISRGDSAIVFEEDGLVYD